MFNAGTTPDGVWVKSSDGINFEKCKFAICRGIHQYYIKEDDMGNMTVHLIGLSYLFSKEKQNNFSKRLV